MNKYNIEISDRGKIMLGAHIKFLAQLNPAAAKKLKKNILKSIRSLSSMPERCPFFDNEFIPRNKYHKLFTDKWYLILYQIKGSTVFVEYILDCRQEYKWLVR